MDQYVSSLAKACLTWSGIENFHDENVPLNFAVPALYFPPPEVAVSPDSLNGHQTGYTIYANVFALTRQDALSYAEKIVQGIMAAGCRIPVLNYDDTESGNMFKMDFPEARVIDEGVAQITLSYRIALKRKEEEQPKATEVVINKDFD